MLSFSAPGLVAETARRANFGFSLDANDAEVVKRICQLVDAMPLGVIMAASWVGALALPEIADELSTSLDINKSLVQREPRGGRYVVHELLRQYADGKLQDVPLEVGAIRERHAQYYAKFLNVHEGALKGYKLRQASRDRVERGNIPAARS